MMSSISSTLFLCSSTTSCSFFRRQISVPANYRSIYPPQNSLFPNFFPYFLCSDLNSTAGDELPWFLPRLPSKALQARKAKGKNGESLMEKGWWDLEWLREGLRSCTVFLKAYIKVGFQFGVQRTNFVGHLICENSTRNCKPQKKIDEIAVNYSFRGH